MERQNFKLCVALGVMDNKEVTLNIKNSFMGSTLAHAISKEQDISVAPTVTVTSLRYLSSSHINFNLVPKNLQKKLQNQINRAQSP